MVLFYYSRISHEMILQVKFKQLKVKPNQLLKKSSPRLTEDVLIQQRAVLSMINKKKSNYQILERELNFFAFQRERGWI